MTAAFAVSIFWLRGERPQQRSEEAPFADVVRERESKAAAAADTSATKAPVIPAPAALPDTLLLEGTARETVWVRMVTDGLRPAEYTFRPSVRMTWKGKKGFVLSLGDGAAMTFTLNGTPLGRLGVAHKPLREFPITTETLRLARAAAAGAGRSAAQ